MKKLILLFLTITLSVLTSCTKQEEKLIKTYDLTFSALHSVTQENQFCNPKGYYYFSVDDGNLNNKYKKEGVIIRQSISDKTIAKSGDFIYVSFSVGDVFDYGYASCVSSDGSVNIKAYTDNLYIDQSAYTETKSIRIDNKDTILKFKVVRLQLK
jgi:hypothetical protein